ncbi:hypothetical protein SAMN05444007_108219 [Cribrihabitans marinus]|uniref:Uncharacterized protein n=1 Tax=Cribrihabitans marinus TaxID=1227549 RepID=A0A1H7CNJ0_9RHOB|nr:hypothetical protein [Cribrihabitans marinus]GGH36100.1 hypothetical protein GCM10010973_29870 [Cribrihabitans marinus]SEJ91026.1 hypothetical protein SAMN05444007_108219 [Cribrihabitans marinus]
MSSLKNNARIDAAMEYLTRVISEEKEAGRADVHSWAAFLVDDAGNSAVYSAGCDCPGCALKINQAAVHHFLGKAISDELKAPRPTLGKVH